MPILGSRTKIIFLHVWFAWALTRAELGNLVECFPYQEQVMVEGEDKDVLANKERTGLISDVVRDTPDLCSKECKMNKECLQWEWRQQLKDEEIHKWVGENL